MTPVAGFALLLCLAGAPADKAEDNRVKEIVAKFKELAAGDRGKFLRQLSAKRDVAGLTAIAKTDETFSEWAAGEAVKLVPSERVVAYIQQFRPGTATWEFAMYSTEKHPKEAIIEYVKTVRQQVYNPRCDPRVQVCCYHLCRERGWDDLRAAAQAALKDERAITIPNSDPETVGEAAQKYLKSLEKKSSRP